MRRPPPPRALVLASGGLDSAVALWWAKARFGDIAVLHFTPGGRPHRERQALLDLARSAGVADRLEIPLPALRGPGPGCRRRGGYLPARNLVFYAIALSIAERRGIPFVVGGHTREDGRIFSDATPAFFRGLRRLARAGGASPPRLLMPLIALTHTRVARLGLRLGVPIGKTWSCYRDGLRPCGGCNACRTRSAALRRASDPPPGPPR